MQPVRGWIIFRPRRIPEMTGFWQPFIGCARDGNRRAYRFPLRTPARTCAVWKAGPMPPPSPPRGQRGEDRLCLRSGAGWGRARGLCAPPHGFCGKGERHHLLAEADLAGAIAPAATDPINGFRTEAQSLRPAPARPSAGASPPPGQGPDGDTPDRTGPGPPQRKGAGKGSAFPCPRQRRDGEDCRRRLVIFVQWPFRIPRPE